MSVEKHLRSTEYINVVVTVLRLLASIASNCASRSSLIMRFLSLVSRNNITIIVDSLLTPACDDEGASLSRNDISHTNDDPPTPLNIMQMM